MSYPFLMALLTWWRRLCQYLRLARQQVLFYSISDIVVTFTPQCSIFARILDPFNYRLRHLHHLEIAKCQLIVHQNRLNRLPALMLLVNGSSNGRNQYLSLRLIRHLDETRAMKLRDPRVRVRMSMSGRRVSNGSLDDHFHGQYIQLLPACRNRLWMVLHKGRFPICPDISMRFRNNHSSRVMSEIHFTTQTSWHAASNVTVIPRKCHFIAVKLFEHFHLCLHLRPDSLIFRRKCWENAVYSVDFVEAFLNFRSFATIFPRHLVENAVRMCVHISCWWRHT